MPNLVPPLLLNRNESHFEPVSELQDLLRTWDWSNSLRFYTSSQDLRELELSLVNHLKLDNPKRLCLFHGAEDALLKLFLWKNGKCKSLVLPDFSWNQYLILATGLDFSLSYYKVQKQSYEFSHSIDDLNQILYQKDDSALVLLPCPNNPTGHSLNPSEIATLLATHPKHTFILDGVYEPFPSKFCKVLEMYTNCYFVSSLSKFFGLPGMRFGYAMGDFPRAMQLDLGPQSLSVAVAKTVLQCVPKFENQWAKMLLEAEQLRLKINESIPGAHAFSTQANFLLVDLGPHLDAALEAKDLLGIVPKIIFRDNRHYMRWSLGPPQVMNMLFNWTETWANLIKETARDSS